MELILAAGTIYLNTILSDADGTRLYKIETNIGLTLDRTTTISKFAWDTDALQPLAKINWHFFKPSTIEYRGQEVDVDKFLPRKGPFLHQRARTFTASDGHSYKWILLRDTWSLGTKFLELENDESTVIASFHKENKNKAERARLEVLAEGEKIVDDVVVTFVYAEKFRQERTGETGHGPGAPYVFSKGPEGS